MLIYVTSKKNSCNGVHKFEINLKRMTLNTSNISIKRHLNEWQNYAGSIPEVKFWCIKRQHLQLCKRNTYFLKTLIKNILKLSKSVSEMTGGSCIHTMNSSH